MREIVEGIAAHFRGLGLEVRVVTSNVCQSMEITEPGNWRNFILMLEGDRIEIVGDPDHEERALRNEVSLFDSPYVDLADPRCLELIEAAMRRRFRG